MVYTIFLDCLFKSWLYSFIYSYKNVFQNVKIFISMDPRLYILGGKDMWIGDGIELWQK